MAGSVFPAWPFLLEKIVEHRDIPDNELHEPKGAVSALQGTFYKSNGQGSGSWGKLTDDNVEGLGANTAEGRLITAGGGGTFASREAVFSSNEVTHEGDSLSTVIGNFNTVISDLLTRVEALEDEVASLQNRVDALEGA